VSGSKHGYMNKGTLSRMDKQAKLVHDSESQGLATQNKLDERNYCRRHLSDGGLSHGATLIKLVTSSCEDWASKETSNRC
jgi:hypothetical protein